VGGADQLRTFASILGVAFQAVESTASLAQAIDTAPSDALLLIDTPGYSTTMLGELGSELVSFLASRQDIDTHLVLTASMRPSSLRTVAGAYARFQPAKLLFTRLDETSSYATAYCEAVRQALPLSFFANGQDIPEDLEPADKKKVSESLVRQLPRFLQAVA
jgi:flagellar biosynthesis protein FlhF